MVSDGAHTCVSFRSTESMVNLSAVLQKPAPSLSDLCVCVCTFVRISEARHPWSRFRFLQGVCVRSRCRDSREAVVCHVGHTHIYMCVSQFHKHRVCGHGSGLRCLSVVSGDADVCVCKWWWPCAAVVDGAALKVAERRKRATYPELERGGPQKLVVLGSEVGGRWNEQARRLVQDLVRLKGHRAPRALRAAASGAWARRWWSMLSVAVQQAVASKRPAQR